MQENIDLFIGLSNTAWTALSSIATFCAVALALWFPISEKISRRSKVYRTIENEISENFLVLEKAKNPSNRFMDLSKAPKHIITGYTLDQINTSYWDQNKQYVSESSLKRYNEYRRINKDLNELKDFAKELLSSEEYHDHLEKIEIAFESVYVDMKAITKYWRT
jgi:hypothetical protein